MTTWIVTGCSTGLGRALVVALLERRIPVVATARNLASIADLEEKGATTFEWDVTSPLATLQGTAAEIDAKVGGIAVLVNNAGYGILGTIEECTHGNAQFNTNVFGLLNTTRAFLPMMRSRKRGTIVNISSIGAYVGNGCSGLYCATKAATEAITASLAMEIAPLGLRAMSVALGGFRTALLSKELQVVGPIEDYKPITTRMEETLKYYDGRQPGDPAKGANVIIDTVLGEGVAQGKAFPAVLFLGPEATNSGEKALKAKLESLEEWRDVCVNTGF